MTFQSSASGFRKESLNQKERKDNFIFSQLGKTQHVDKSIILSHPFELKNMLKLGEQMFKISSKKQLNKKTSRFSLEVFYQ